LVDRATYEFVVEGWQVTVFILEISPPQRVIQSSSKI
jgi:hypothetical protein